jgi:hypothetical protein
MVYTPVKEVKPRLFALLVDFGAILQLHREEIKAEFWADEIAWTGDKPATGWFRAPRTLPLILTLLADKKISPASGRCSLLSAGPPLSLLLGVPAARFPNGSPEIEYKNEEVARAAGKPCDWSHRS